MGQIRANDIYFSDDIDFEIPDISAYLEETDALDKKAGLLSEYDYDGDEFIGHCDYFNVNYYACYNTDTKEFYVDISVSIYDDDVYEVFPDISNKLKYYDTTKEICKLELTKAEKEMIFENFKKYIVTCCGSKLSFEDLVKKEEEEYDN